jgi:hypothetical protein
MEQKIAIYTETVLRAIYVGMSTIGIPCCKASHSNRFLNILIYGYNK